MSIRHANLSGALVLAALLLSGCGGGGASSTGAGLTARPATRAAPSSSSTSASAGTGGAGALSAEVRATATGDIPDNQQFLTYRDHAAGYQLVYPEGWTQKAGARTVTFQDKNNLIRVVVMHGTAPSPASVTAQLAREKARVPSLAHGSASTISVAGSPVVKISYSTISAPNPVTGKRIRLLVDRYVYARAGKVAVLDLATPKGVDNVDAYRRISMSWRWT